MKLCLLHLDDALKSQKDFMETCARDSARHIDATEEGSNLRLWGKNKVLEKLKSKIAKGFSNTSEPMLCFMGSGDFHHVTALLLEETLKNSSEPITIIHFDNHPDWVNFEDGMHCGSWVNRAVAIPNVKKIITIGVCSKDLKNPEFKGANLSLLTSGILELFPYRHKPCFVRKKYGPSMSYTQKNNKLDWNTISSLGEQEFITKLLYLIKTKSIYITVDKDVLAAEDAITNWDQGMMSLSYLLEIITRIGKSYKILGADVTGDYSKPKYTGNIFTRLSKRFEILMDQPKICLDSSDIDSINSSANHALLEVFSGVMA